MHADTLQLWLPTSKSECMLVTGIRLPKVSPISSIFLFLLTCGGEYLLDKIKMTKFRKRVLAAHPSLSIWKRLHKLIQVLLTKTLKDLFPITMPSMRGPAAGSELLKKVNERVRRSKNQKKEVVPSGCCPRHNLVHSWRHPMDKYSGQTASKWPCTTVMKNPTQSFNRDVLMVFKTF